MANVNIFNSKNRVMSRLVTLYCPALNPLKTEFLHNFIYKSNPYLTGNTYVSATKPNWLMLFGETVAVYCENRTEHTDTLCR
jgi:hypothetical protein